MRLSGRARSALIIGGQGIRARKLRTLLSMVSLFLGVLAVVTVQAGAEIAGRAVLDEVELTQGRDGTRQWYLPSHASTVPVTLDVLRGRTDAVAYTSLSAIVGEPRVTPLNPGGSPVDQGGAGGAGYYCNPDGSCFGPGGEPGAVERPSGQAIELQLVGVTGDLRQFRPFRVDSGQWLDFSGEPSLSPRIVLNREAAKAFARYPVPSEMRLSGADTNPTPRIVGVVHDAGYGPTAYVRADELLNWLPVSGLGGNQYGPGLQLMTSSAVTDLEPILRARLAANGVRTDEIYIQTVNAKEDYRDQLRLMRMIFLGIAGLVLLIGVAGILNVGLATVGERVEEFALRRAVGTPRLLLAGIVLTETLLTGLLTAVAAVGAGMAGLTLADPLLGSRITQLQDVEFPWQAGAAGVVAGLVAGILGGLIPALRAARIPIATVMRA